MLHRKPSDQRTKNLSTRNPRVKIRFCFRYSAPGQYIVEQPTYNASPPLKGHTNPLNTFKTSSKNGMSAESRTIQWTSKKKNARTINQQINFRSLTLKGTTKEQTSNSQRTNINQTSNLRLFCLFVEVMGSICKSCCRGPVLTVVILGIVQASIRTTSKTKTETVTGLRNLRSLRHGGIFQSTSTTHCLFRSGSLMVSYTFLIWWSFRLLAHLIARIVVFVASCCVCFLFLFFSTWFWKHLATY